MMPDMSGPEMAMEMRLKQPDIKLLYMSGYPEDKSNVPDFSGEQTRFIKKPFGPADLAKLVQKCMSESTIKYGEQKE